MKLLVLFVCALAIVKADWAPAHYGFHVPVIGPGGVPVETPEVQHAKAAHFAALNAASAHSGPHDDGSYDGRYDGGHDGSHAGSHADARYYGPHAYPTTHGAAHVTHDGVPLETPEVAAAKAHHFSAFSEALARATPHGHGYGHYRKRRGVYAGHWAHGIHVPVIHNGVPVDTPEVQHAKAAHFAALAAAGGHGHGADVYGPAYGHGYAAYHAGVHDYNFYGVGHDGRPLDTPVVAHAKQAALAAYNEAAARNGVGHAAHYAGPWAYAGYHHAAAVPADTPEVAHAKAAHFAAHAAARAHHY